MPKSFHQGTAVELDTLVYTDDTLATLKNVTGFTVVGRLGNKTKRITYLEVAGALVDGPAGQVRVTLTPAQTSALAPGLIDYICEVTDAGSNPGVVTDEQVEVLPALPDLP